MSRLSGGYNIDVDPSILTTISTAGTKKKRRRRKPGGPPKGVIKSYASVGWNKSAIAYSGLNPGLKKLISDIYAGHSDADTYFNHGYNQDPATRGAVPGDVSVSVYYQPASANEETISNEGVLSGRRRLVVRVQTCRYPDHTESWAFYTTNHPERKNGITNNAYGVFTPIDMNK